MGNHRPANVTPFKWRADNGPTLDAGLVVSDFSWDPDQFCKGTLYFYDFSVGGGDPEHLSVLLGPRMLSS